MVRLFVDVDDTLVLWQNQNVEDAQGIYYDTPWKVNQAILDGIFEFDRDHPGALIVVWSGGGMEYAQEWIDLFGLHDIAIAIVKDQSTFHLILPGDIVVDDIPLQVGVRVYAPDQWPGGSPRDR